MEPGYRRNSRRQQLLARHRLDGTAAFGPLAEETRNLMNIDPDMKEKDLVEVIYPALDGNIYFLDLETGKPTREKIKIGFPIKGTGMIDREDIPALHGHGG